MTNSKITELTDQQLLQYSRQILLPKFDVEGQLALLNSRVLIVGLGGLGSPVAMYLAAAGVGSLVLCDHDRVDLSNLQRQIVHHHGSIDRPKIESARDTLQAQNPEIHVDCESGPLVRERLFELLPEIDLVIDCTDNFKSRFMLNEACFAFKVPLVSGAAIRMEGQVSVFDPRIEDSPCYQCLYSPQGNEDLSCSESGVLSPVVGVIGTMQALEAIKLLGGMGKSLAGRLLVFDAMQSSWREFALRRDPQCAVCGSSS